MNPSADSLLDSVLALPEAERVAITEALLDSLTEESLDLDDRAFAEELERRSEEMKSDPTAGISWAELKKMR